MNRQGEIHERVDELQECLQEGRKERISYNDTPWHEHGWMIMMYHKLCKVELITLTVSQMLVLLKVRKNLHLPVSRWVAAQHASLNVLSVIYISSFCSQYHLCNLMQNSCV